MSYNFLLLISVINYYKLLYPSSISFIVIIYNSSNKINNINKTNPNENISDFS